MGHGKIDGLTDYLEAVVVLLPTDVGGRAAAIAPRGGEFRPIARAGDGAMLRIRIIEGPPHVAPGQNASVVAEVETPFADELLLRPGTELDLVEHERVVGILTVARLWRGAIVV